MTGSNGYAAAFNYGVETGKSLKEMEQLKNAFLAGYKEAKNDRKENFKFWFSIFLVHLCAFCCFYVLFIKMGVAT